MNAVTYHDYSFCPAEEYKLTWRDWLLMIVLLPGMWVYLF